MSNTENTRWNDSAGGDGGKIVAQGTPEQVARVKASHTGHYLQKCLDSDVVCG